MKGRKPGTIVTGAEALTKVPPPPSTLTGSARNEWKRSARILVARRHLTAADLSVLESYCVAIGLRDEARRILAASTITYSAGALIKVHPATGILRDALSAILRHAAELGLTIVSRSRVTSDQEDADDLAFLD